MFVVLDPAEVAYDPSDPSKLDRYAKLSLHGDCFDRWYDKSLSLVVFKNGCSCSNVEHSYADGPVSLCLFTAFSMLDHLQCFSFRLKYQHSNTLFYLSSGFDFKQITNFKENFFRIYVLSISCIYFRKCGWKNCRKNTFLHYLANGLASRPGGGPVAWETRCLICIGVLGLKRPGLLN